MAEKKTTFRCGHPRTEDNIRISSGYDKCRQCSNEKHKEWERRKRESMTLAERQLFNRKRYLPKQLEDARRKVRDLEAEALRMGLDL